MCADITIIDDDLCEEPETFSISLTEMDSNVVLNGPRRGTVTIDDNDGMGVIHNCIIHTCSICVHTEAIH